MYALDRGSSKGSNSPSNRDSGAGAGVNTQGVGVRYQYSVKESVEQAGPTLADEMAMIAAELEDEERATRPVFDADASDDPDGWRWEQMHDWLDEQDYLRGYSIQM